MQWIVDNWLILLLVGGMLAMHMFGHGHGRGGHGGDGGVQGRRSSSGDDAGLGPETRDARARADEMTGPASDRPTDDGRT